MSLARDRLSSGLTRDRLKLELRRSRRPAIVFAGLLVIAAGAAFLLAKNANVFYPWQDPYVMRFAVDNAKGISAPNQEVRLAGVRVGNVSAVELADGQPVVEMTIEREYVPVYRDARLRVRPQTPLEDLYVAIEDRGTPAAGEVEPGGTLRAERTQQSVQIGRVLNVFSPPTRDRMEAAIDETGRGLRDNGDQLRAAFVQVVPFLKAAQRLSGAIAGRSAATKRLVRNFRLLMEELDHRERTLTALVASGEASLSELARNDADFGALLEQFPPTLNQLLSTLRVVRPTLDQVDPALTALRPTANAFEGGLSSLRSFSRHARPALTALEGPVRTLRGPVRDLRPAVDDVTSAFARLRPQAPRFDRVTGAVERCELAFQKFFQWTPSVFKYGDRHGTFPRGESVNIANPQRPASCTDGSEEK